MKPKRNHKGDPGRFTSLDYCQTPPDALDSILEYCRGKIVWECAAGEGLLVDRISEVGAVVSSDILSGQNFFDYQPRKWDVIVTNPPYSIKYDWLERCYELGKPFALLMPVEMLGAQRAQRLFVRYGVELTFLPRRVNFKMPNKGWGGSAQFPVMWYSWKFTNVPIRFFGVPNQPRLRRIIKELEDEIAE